MAGAVAEAGAEIMDKGGAGAEDKLFLLNRYGTDPIRICFRIHNAVGTGTPYGLPDLWIPKVTVPKVADYAGQANDRPYWYRYHVSVQFIAV